MAEHETATCVSAKNQPEPMSYWLAGPELTDLMRLALVAALQCSAWTVCQHLALLMPAELSNFCAQNSNPTMLGTLGLGQLLPEIGCDGSVCCHVGRALSPCCFFQGHDT